MGGSTLLFRNKTGARPGSFLEGYRKDASGKRVLRKSLDLAINTMLNSSRLEAPESKVVERRGSRRFPLELEVRYKTLSQRAELVEGTGKTLNISSSGVLFTSESELPVGTALEVSINWPARLNDSCFLNLVGRGRVTRQAKGQLALQFRQHEFRTQSKLGREKQLDVSSGKKNAIKDTHGPGPGPQRSPVVLPRVSTNNCNGRTGGSKSKILTLKENTS